MRVKFNRKPKKRGTEMIFIDLYDRIDTRTKELMSDGKDEKEARTLAWQEFHEEIS